MRKNLIPLAALLLLAVGVGVVWLRGNLDSLVAQAIRDYGSAMTQARVEVAKVSIQSADGHGTLQNLFIGNPQGFKTAHALTAQRVELEVDIASLASDTIVLRKVTILAPDIVYEKNDVHTNFDALQKNITRYLGLNPGKKEKKFIVEDFVLRGAKVQASAAFMNGKTMAVPLPDIHLHNLGQANGGATAAELAAEITAAIQARLTGAVRFDKLMQSAGNALEKAGQAIRGLFE